MKKAAPLFSAVRQVTVSTNTTPRTVSLTTWTHPRARAHTPHSTHPHTQEPPHVHRICLSGECGSDPGAPRSSCARHRKIKSGGNMYDGIFATGHPEVRDLVRELPVKVLRPGRVADARRLEVVSLFHVITSLGWRSETCVATWDRPRGIRFDAVMSHRTDVIRAAHRENSRETDPQSNRSTSTAHTVTRART